MFISTSSSCSISYNNSSFNDLIIRKDHWWLFKPHSLLQDFPQVHKTSVLEIETSLTCTSGSSTLLRFSKSSPLSWLWSCWSGILPLQHHECLPSDIKYNNNNNNNNNFPETRKYWVDVQQGIVSSHGERDPL